MPLRTVWPRPCAGPSWPAGTDCWSARRDRATWPEVEELLSRELPLRAVLDVCVRAHARGIRPGLLWTWTRHHGAPLLALAVAAGLDEPALQHHLTEVGSLDRESLELHAELNRSPVVAVRTRGGLLPWH